LVESEVVSIFSTSRPQWRGGGRQVEQDCASVHGHGFCDTAKQLRPSWTPTACGRRLEWDFHAGEGPVDCSKGLAGSGLIFTGLPESNITGRGKKATEKLARSRRSKKPREGR